MPKTCQNNLTLFAEDTHASHSVLPGSKEAKKMTVTSGRKCSDLSKNVPHPLGSLLKMLLVTSEWGSTMCYLTWKAQVTSHNRLLFRLVPSMPRIEGIESGLWATQNTMDHLPPRSKEGILKLANGHRKGRSRPSNLREQVSKETMEMWPTPVHHECRLGYQNRSNGKKGTQKSLTTEVIDRAGGRSAVIGQLNPQWVEWLMGYPIGWTELNPSETP